MSATVGAALKKIAVSLLTNPKVLKTVGGIVLGVVVLIIMPIAAVVSVFNGEINIDSDRLQQMVVENLSAEEQAKLQKVEDTMLGIEEKMNAAGFTGRVKEAQVLYVLALSDHAAEDGFIDKLIGCFATDQSDEQLIAAVNTAFGTELASEDFTKIMENIRDTASKQKYTKRRMNSNEYKKLYCKADRGQQIPNHLLSQRRLFDIQRCNAVRPLQFTGKSG